MTSGKSNVCIIDYGFGNVNSVYNAFKSFHDSVMVSNDAKDMEKATHLVLPGVGAFKAAIDKIKKMPTFELLEYSVLNKKKMFLGICVGMQVLADVGHEHGSCDGLGWIPGAVKRINAPNLSLPHVGWNNIRVVRKSPLLEGMSDNTDFYYVHSYHLEPLNSEEMMASSNYGEEFAAIVNRDNIYGVQFHPEKSQKAGIMLLKNFMSLK
ncbi:MAG: imidazole glycerol phosphate synthase subunit HisH [Candidatus Omnitrophota bacterium]|nr:imidazole glycerol phosphate synthase subunit HisH [Candidatus Omnitrophota bacterium]